MSEISPQSRPSKSEILRDTTLEAALAEVSNVVYLATGFIEDLEHAGKVRGNGHHHRQALALEGQVTVLRNWENSDEIAALDPMHPAVQRLGLEAEAAS